MEKRVVDFIREDVELNIKRGRRLETSTSSDISKAVSDAREFEELARRVMSKYFHVRLEKRRKPGWPKEFDLVSRDYRIVGDAKYYTMVKGRRLPQLSSPV